jgi:uncharacterized protein (DUF305 family)
MRRLVLVCCVLLAACTGSGKADRPASGSLSDADVAFAQRLLAQDDQATEVVELVEGHTTRPELRQLAKDVTVSRGDEIVKLQEWLQRWGKPVQPEAADSETLPPGLLSDEQLNQLDALTGTKFDLAFADSLTALHQGAVRLAEAELAEGSLGEVRQLAEQVKSGRQAEIGQLARWKQAWSQGS